jgi:hypothetical protein
MIHVYVFTSPTCEPCDQIKPTINELEEEYSEFRWKYVNIKDDPEKLTERFGVKSVPTMLVTHDDGLTVLGVHSGVIPLGYFLLLKKARRLLP